MDARDPLELSFREKTRWIRDGWAARAWMNDSDCLRYGYELLLTVFFCHSFSIDGTSRLSLNYT